MKQDEESRKLSKAKIPEGTYCYTITDITKDFHIKIILCPYWRRISNKPSQMNGYCIYLGKGDWDLDGSLLWDQVKECGENDEY